MTAPKTNTHARTARLVESLSELAVSAEDCRRISSALTTLGAVDYQALRMAVVHLETSAEPEGQALLGLVRVLRRPM